MIKRLTTLVSLIVLAIALFMDVDFAIANTENTIVSNLHKESITMQENSEQLKATCKDKQGNLYECAH